MVNLPFIRSIIDDLDFIQRRFVNQLPLIIIILGLIGFIGNLFTFLQPTLRQNSICIHTLSASFIDIINLFINLFPLYLNPSTGNLAASITNRSLCKLKLFALVFFPQLSLNLLIMSLIDRYACTFGPTSSMSRLLQLRTVPWMIFITIIISCIMSLYPIILYDVLPGFGCGSMNPTINAIIYIGIHGIMTPIIMLIFVLLTYRKIIQRRQRIGAMLVASQNRYRNQFIAMIFAQVSVTSFLVLQWMGMYSYFWITKNTVKSAEDWAIIYFLLSLTNNLYYFINVRSFYLSTLTSRLFRQAMFAGFLKLFRRTFH
ncbi:unnamed protein product [Adineta ricciae]|uniref:G-protein coupled receptors family 1 profile domain-containing protein n=1 Tax=Adineta ricciae TaxID=249248 RepID=A0A815UUY8_ADIRI|nr:unnamed protein product [Adineta ricciae]